VLCRRMATGGHDDLMRRHRTVSLASSPGSQRHELFPYSLLSRRRWPAENAWEALPPQCSGLLPGVKNPLKPRARRRAFSKPCLPKRPFVELAWTRRPARFHGITAGGSDFGRGDRWATTLMGDNGWTASRAAWIMAALRYLHNGPNMCAGVPPLVKGQRWGALAANLRFTSPRTQRREGSRERNSERPECGPRETLVAPNRRDLRPL
jgi:hypothetical protein